MKVKTIFLFHKVPLGLIAKNENLNEDMVDILDHLQSLYVPMTEKRLASGGTEKVPLETVFFWRGSVSRGTGQKCAAGEIRWHNHRREA